MTPRPEEPLEPVDPGMNKAILELLYLSIVVMFLTVIASILVDGLIWLVILSILVSLVLGIAYWRTRY